ncbi:MAG TPA: hypothetical protein PK335_08430, partial [Draconibacterium sp.]|nr:hypothetical protein [Draconibacterium sp.]
EHINPFKNADSETEDISPSAISRPQKIVDTIASAAIYPEAESSDSTDSEKVIPNHPEPAPQQDKISAEVPKSKPIEFVINDDFTYRDTSNFRTKEGLDSFLNWKKDQQALDSLTTLLAQLRSDYAAARNTLLRNELGQKIMDAESQLLPLQRKVKEQLNKSRLAENNYWDNASPDEYNALFKQLQKLSQLHDTTEEQNIPKIDTSLIIAEVFEDVVPSTPAVKEETNDELVYKIQIGAYSRGLPNYVKKQFDKLSYIRKIENYTDDRGVVVYTTGNLTNLDDAVKMQKQVRQEGIEDAFVVPYFNGKRITLEEAKKIEKER